MKKIIFINIILCLFLFLCSELYFYQIFKKEAHIEHFCYFQNNHTSSLRDFPPAGNQNTVNKYDNVENIAMLGCSYTHGQGLKKEETFSFLLSKYTKKNVYNLAQSGYGAGLALSVLLNENKNHSLLKNKQVHTFIYTYMFHHIQRMNQWNFYNMYRKMNYIPNQKYNFLYNSYTYLYFKNRELDNYFFDDPNYSKRLALFYNLMREIKIQSNKLSPDSQFIVLIYNDINYDLSDSINHSFNYDTKQIQEAFNIMESNKFKETLEEFGFKVVTTENLIGRKMNLPQDRLENDEISKPHPSKKIWKIVVPLFVKKMKL